MTLTPSSEPASTIANPLLPRYEAILARQRLGWMSRRPFLRCLGVGGQGIVFLSERQGSDEFRLPVALKLYSPERYRDAGEYEREMARLGQVTSRVARIQQDNLIDVHNFIRRGGIRILEMEWVDGYDLQCLLRPTILERVRHSVSDDRWGYINNVIVTEGKHQPRLKPGIAVAILRGCFAALAALHRDGVIHSDLKPSNIMLKRTGSVKIIDVGSAFEVLRPPDATRCSPAYAAPEVLEGNPGTAASDLASLGYVLIEMLAGAQPFAGIDGLGELLKAKKQILHQLPRILPPEEIAYNELLINLIRGLVDPDPARRFPTAEAADLSEVGAASFQRQLVKGDLATEYENELRLWIDEVELTGAVDVLERASGFDPTLATTRFVGSLHLEDEASPP